MRRLTLLLVLLIPSAAFCAQKVWQDSTLTAVTTNDNAAAVLPVGPMLYGTRINRSWYVFDTAETRYILFNGVHKPLNVTVHGKTKIAIDGQKAFIVDDSGKQIKLPISQKIARKQP